MRRNPSQEVRDRHGEQLFHVYTRLLYGGRLFHADPNPGNYLFMPDGRLGLLDFGYLFPKTSEIGGKNRGRQLNHHAS